MALSYNSLALLFLFMTSGWSQNSDNSTPDLRGPCGPCYIDASAIEVFYWVTETVKFVGYTKATNVLTFDDKIITQTTLVDESCTESTLELDIPSIKTANAIDLNVQQGRFTTVVGDEYYAISTTVISEGESTDTIQGTGTILTYSTAYFAYTSLDVYLEAATAVGADGEITCLPRTKYPIIISETIHLPADAAPTIANYGTITTFGPQAMQTALVQVLQGNDSLLEEHPELANCGAGVVQGTPYALVPIDGTHRGNLSTTTEAPYCTRSVNGPLATKAVGDLLVPIKIKGPYVAPQVRIFPGKSASPSNPQAIATAPPTVAVVDPAKTQTPVSQSTGTGVVQPSNEQTEEVDGGSSTPIGDDSEPGSDDTVTTGGDSSVQDGQPAVTTGEATTSAGGAVEPANEVSVSIGEATTPAGDAGEPANGATVATGEENAQSTLPPGISVSVVDPLARPSTTAGSDILSAPGSEDEFSPTDEASTPTDTSEVGQESTTPVQFTGAASSYKISSQFLLQVCFVIFAITIL